MLALEGIRILDLSRLAPGPFATMVLADLGADVLMIEAPGGATSELHLPWADPDPARQNAFDALRRNKRSLVLNLKHERGREVLHRLAAEADVLVEGFRPGVMARLGSDYATLAQVNPRLVFCSVSGYGQDGPRAQEVGHDINYIALGGLLGITGRPGQPPAIPGNIVADFAAGGLQAAVAVLAALVARATTGRGQHVDVAMSDGVLYLLATWAQRVLAGQPAPRPGEDWLTGRLPQYDVYETRDGKWISIGALETKFWRALCEATGAPQLAERNPLEPDVLAKARAHLTRVFRERTRDEWMAVLEAAEVCAAPVYGLDEAVQDPHHRARRMVTELRHPTLGPIPHIGVAPKFSDTPGAVRTLPPEPGEHTDAVLAGLGYDAAAVAQLRRAGAVA